MSRSAVPTRAGSTGTSSARSRGAGRLRTGSPPAPRWVPWAACSTRSGSGDSSPRSSPTGAGAWASSSPMPADRLGAHMSIAGGLHLALERAKTTGCSVVQLFVKNQVQWAARPLTDEDVRRFKKARRTTGITEVFAHSTYLINLATPAEAEWRRGGGAFAGRLGGAGGGVGGAPRRLPRQGGAGNRGRGRPYRGGAPRGAPGDPGARRRAGQARGLPRHPPSLRGGGRHPEPGGGGRPD